MSIYKHRALRQHPEDQYLDILAELVDRSTSRETRNDTATKSVFGRQMRFDLANGFPLLTTKKLPFSVIAKELLWFLSGSTNVRPLQAQGVKIWDEWADENGNLGPIYGKQMRNWTNRPDGSSTHPFYGIDQIDGILQGLRDNPTSRRHVMTTWNPADIPDMALPPCHGLVTQFYVGDDERLSLSMYQRSADVFLGLPFNIASYSLLLEMFAAVLGRQAGEFIWMGGDVHLYGNHLDAARAQLLRDPRPFPTITVSQQHLDLDHWSISDFTLRDYNPHSHIPAKVSV